MTLKSNAPVTWPQGSDRLSVGWKSWVRRHSASATG